jgi:hypothetical protein
MLEGKMNKRVLAVFLAVFGGAALFAQANPNQEVNDAIKTLGDCFEKYEWVHLTFAEKTEDTRATSAKIDRLSYDIPVDENGEEKIKQGEVLYLRIIKAGYRYDMKFDFSPKKLRSFERSRTVQNRVFKSLLVDILPEKAES